MIAPLHGSGVGDPQTVLIRVSGPDRPGINAGLMAVLDTCYRAEAEGSNGV